MKTDSNSQMLGKFFLPLLVFAVILIFGCAANQNPNGQASNSSDAQIAAPAENNQLNQSAANQGDGGNSVGEANDGAGANNGFVPSYLHCYDDSECWSNRCVAGFQICLPCKNDSDCHPGTACLDEVCTPPTIVRIDSVSCTIRSRNNGTQGDLGTADITATGTASGAVQTVFDTGLNSDGWLDCGNWKNTNLGGVNYSECMRTEGDKDATSWTWRGELANANISELNKSNYSANIWRKEGVAQPIKCG